MPLSVFELAERVREATTRQPSCPMCDSDAGHDRACPARAKTPG
jgi:hypothetical protein